MRRDRWVLNDTPGMNGHTPATLVNPADLPRPPLRTIRPTGTWRYRARRRSRVALWGAMAFSAGLHGLLLFGFNFKSAPKRQLVYDEPVAVTLIMPELKDLEPETTPFEGDEEPVAAGVSVPMLADVPSQVDLSNAFVQQIDYSTLVPQQDLSSAKVISIPPIIHRGTKIGEGMGKIFDLKDLDRAPDPIVRIAPVMPVGMRQPGFRAEVTVGFIVDVNGAVVGAYVVRTTERRLEDPALLAISKWKFRPGIKNGRRVNVRMLQPLVFTVREDE